MAPVPLKLKVSRNRAQIFRRHPRQSVLSPSSIRGHSQRPRGRAPGVTPQPPLRAWPAKPIPRRFHPVRSMVHDRFRELPVPPSSRRRVGGEFLLEPGGGERGALAGARRRADAVRFAGASACNCAGSPAYSRGSASGIVARSCATFISGPLRPTRAYRCSAACAPRQRAEIHTKIDGPHRVHKAIKPVNRRIWAGSPSRNRTPC